MVEGAEQRSNESNCSNQVLTLKIPLRVVLSVMGMLRQLPIILYNATTALM